MGDAVIHHPEALAGFQVHAVDGVIGTVTDADQGSLLVRRRWLVWRRVIVPARAVGRIDVADRAVWLDRTRRQIARTHRPDGSGRKAWFVPASNRLPTGNPVLGPEPRRDEPS